MDGFASVGVGVEVLAERGEFLDEFVRVAAGLAREFAHSRQDAVGPEAFGWPSVRVGGADGRNLHHREVGGNGADARPARGEDGRRSAACGERVAVAVGLGEAYDDAGAGQALADEFDEPARDPERLGAALELGVGHGHVVA